MLYKSYSWKVALWLCAISGLVLLVFGAGVAYNVKEEYSEMVDYDAEAMAVAIVQGSLGESYSSDPFLRIMEFDEGSFRGSIYEDNEDEDYKEQNLRLLAVRSSNGSYSYRNKTYWEEEYAVKLNENPLLDLGDDFVQKGFETGDMPSEAEEERWEARLYRMDGVTIYLAVNQHEHKDEYLEIIEHMGIVLPVALLLVAIGGWWVGMFAVKPIRLISGVVASIKPDDLKKRIAEAEREDEIGELSRLINDMLDRIEKGYEQAKRFTADASHELRTPLAILLAEMESKMRESDDSMKSYAPMIEEVHRLKSLTHSLLFLSKADSGTLEIVEDACDLAALAKQVMEDLSELPEAKGLEFEFVEKGEGFTVRGDLILVQQVLMNLLRNATKYNCVDGRVTIWVTSEPNRVRVVIGNSCDGIRSEDRDKLFQRFFRGSKDRNRKSGGFGLGLNIAQTIAKAHGGDVKLLEGKSDWVEFELVLPRVEIK